MTLYKLILPLVILSAMVFHGGQPNASWAQAQAANILSDTAPARDISTSAEDIKLTNSCIETGKEKIYCLCVTKIYKNEMTLRQYRAAVELFSESDTTSAKLTSEGYSQDEITEISSLRQDLSSDAKFRSRCDTAETYFAAANQN